MSAKERFGGLRCACGLHPTTTTESRPAECLVRNQKEGTPVYGETIVINFLLFY